MSALLAPSENPAVLDPQHALTAPERTLLRKLGREGPALSIGFQKGYMLGGTRYSARAMQRFIDKGLARFWRDEQGVKIGLNEWGQLAAWRITASKPGPSTSPDD